MSRADIYVRLGALAIALAIACAVIWSYAMTATIIGTFLARPAQQTPPNPSVVTVSVLPPSAPPPRGRSH